MYTKRNSLQRLWQNRSDQNNCAGAAQFSGSCRRVAWTMTLYVRAVSYPVLIPEMRVFALQYRIDKFIMLCLEMTKKYYLFFCYLLSAHQPGGTLCFLEAFQYTQSHHILPIWTKIPGWASLRMRIFCFENFLVWSNLWSATPEMTL